MAQTRLRGEQTKIKTIRRDNTTNSNQNDTTIISGWGWIDSLNGTTGLTKAVSFGVTFASAPIVLISNMGLQASGTPTSPADFTNPFGAFWYMDDITTTGFNARVMDVVGSTDYNFGFSWIAIGVLA